MHCYSLSSSSSNASDYGPHQPPLPPPTLPSHLHSLAFRGRAHGLYSCYDDKDSFEEECESIGTQEERQRQHLYHQQRQSPRLFHSHRRQQQCYRAAGVDFSSPPPRVPQPQQQQQCCLSDNSNTARCIDGSAVGMAATTPDVSAMLFACAADTFAAVDTVDTVYLSVVATANSSNTTTAADAADGMNTTVPVAARIGNMSSDDDCPDGTDKGSSGGTTAGPFSATAVSVVARANILDRSRAFRIDRKQRWNSYGGGGGEAH